MAVIEESGAPAIARRKRSKKLRRPDLASQWQLMWWKFRRHKMAVFGLVLLGMLVACALFAEFISPYPPGQRDTKYVLGPPMIPQIDRRQPAHALRLRGEARARHGHAAHDL
jgi:hypothetical protein